MRVLAKDFFRVIGKNKGRFLSVFFIVLLGAGFFPASVSAAGICSFRRKNIMTARG